jgi:Family of unknown function (DUF6152)
MKNRCFFLILAILCICITPQLVLAHHGVSDYEYKKLVIAKVKVTRYEWANPHCKIQFEAADETGKVETWTVEAHPPANMTEHGWTRQSLHPGDEVTLHFRPGKDGGPIGLLVKAEFPNGMELSQNFLLLPTGESFSLSEWQKARTKLP